MIGSIAFQINRHSNGRVCDWLVNRIEAIIKALSFVRKRKHEYRTNSARFHPIPPDSTRIESKCYISNERRWPGGFQIQIKRLMRKLYESCSKARQNDDRRKFK